MDSHGDICLESGKLLFAIHSTFLSSGLNKRTTIVHNPYQREFPIHCVFFLLRMTDKVR